VERTVYLATDDPGIWQKEVPTFKEKGYVFLGDSQIGMCVLVFMTKTIFNVITFI